MDGYKRFILSTTRAGMLLWLVVMGGFILGGLLDNLVGMDWDLSWRDTLVATAILLCGVGVYLLSRWFFKIIRFGDL